MKTKNFWSLTVLGAVGAIGIAHPVQAQSTKTPRLMMAANNTVKMGVGERGALAYANVTRIITDDDEVVRAFFQSGKAVLEGVNPGSTTVEIYQTNGTPIVLTVQVGNTNSTPEPLPTIVADPTPPPTNSIAPARSSLTLSLSVAPAPGNPSQAVFTITYGNPGLTPAEDVVVRFPLAEEVSYVTGSGSPGATYDAAQREVDWNLGIVPAGQVDQKLTLRVEPIERRPTNFDSSATIEDVSKLAIASNQVHYSTSTTPLLTVFALPDRFLAGRNGSVLADVKGIEFQQAVDRLTALSVVNGRPGGRFYPSAPAQRAEYAVMTLNGLNLRDLRDITQIKFVLGRTSTVNLSIQNAAGHTVAALIRNTNFSEGEHTAVWNGRVGTSFVEPGRYTYVCTARDARGETTTLKGTLNIVPQTPLNPTGVPSFIDVKPSDWFARYLAAGEKQGLFLGYQDKTFRPKNPISRAEATAIVVRALGLEDLAKQWKDKSVGFLDYQDIPAWANGYVNVAAVVAKTNSGKPIMRGNINNLYLPEKQLRRDEAALIVQRLIDRETTRRVTVSGAIESGTTVIINSRNVTPDEQGRFAFSFDLNTGELPTVLVMDMRGH